MKSNHRAVRLTAQQLKECLRVDPVQTWYSISDPITSGQAEGRATTTTLAKYAHRFTVWALHDDVSGGLLFQPNQHVVRPDSFEISHWF